MLPMSKLSFFLVVILTSVTLTNRSDAQILSTIGNVLGAFGDTITRTANLHNIINIVLDILQFTNPAARLLLGPLRSFLGVSSHVHLDVSKELEYFSADDLDLPLPIPPKIICNGKEVGNLDELAEERQNANSEVTVQVHYNRTRRIRPPFQDQIFKTYMNESGNLRQIPNRGNAWTRGETIRGKREAALEAMLRPFAESRPKRQADDLGDMTFDPPVGHLALESASRERALIKDLALAVLRSPLRLIRFLRSLFDLIFRSGTDFLDMFKRAGDLAYALKKAFLSFSKEPTPNKTEVKGS